MAAPDAAALAPFALPLRREADAVIADANGQTVLIIDPSRNLDEDAAERIADLVFACLTAAPVREEGGAVLDALDEALTYIEQLGANIERNDLDMHLDTVERPFSFAQTMRGRFPSLCTALATREETPATDAHLCYSEHQPGCDCVIPEQKAVPVPSFLERMTANKEAPAEAGEIDLYDDKVQAGIAWTMRQWG